MNKDAIILKMCEAYRADFDTLNRSLKDYIKIQMTNLFEIGVEPYINHRNDNDNHSLD